MKIKPIILVSGEPNSIFSEILFKTLKKIKINKPIILFSSHKLLKLQMKKLDYKINIKILNYQKIKQYKLDNKSINLVNIDYNTNKAFESISKKSNKFITDTFNLALKLIKKEKIQSFINGPISKKSFLNNKYLGITEYISDYFNKKKTCMLIYNKKLSVCPVTTHLPLKLVAKEINNKNITQKVVLVNDFYKIKFGLKPKIAILGLNPHCESVHKYNGDDKIIKPTIKILKKKFNVSGPYSADTIFLKNNRKNFDVIIGMYHDQVLAPYKALYEYDAINITLGLPFDRISPDHGPNERMMGMNISNPLSLIKAIQFLDKS